MKDLDMITEKSERYGNILIYFHFLILGKTLDCRLMPLDSDDDVVHLSKYRNVW